MMAWTEKTRLPPSRAVAGIGLADVRLRNTRFAGHAFEDGNTLLPSLSVARCREKTSSDRPCSLAAFTMALAMTIHLRPGASRQDDMAKATIAEEEN